MEEIAVSWSHPSAGITDEELRLSALWVWDDCAFDPRIKKGSSRIEPEAVIRPERVCLLSNLPSLRAPERFVPLMR